MLEEIIVTAQKREENLQDVAISVTAFSGEQDVASWGSRTRSTSSRRYPA